MKLRIFSTLFISAILTVAADAQYYNNYQHIIGERAAGLGGAYTTISNDSTALWYNPAGLASLTSFNLNVSANTYSYLSKTTKGMLQLQKADGTYESIDSKESEFSIVANTLVFGKQVSEKVGVGFGLFVPFQDAILGNMEASVVGGTLKTDLLDISNTTSKLYVAMFGAGISITDKFRIGASAGIGYYKATYESLSMYYFSDPSSTPYQPLYFGLSRNNVENTQITARGGIGTQLAITENHKLAAYFQSPSYRIKGDSTVTSYDWDMGYESSGSPAYTTGSATKTTAKLKDEKYKKFLPMHFSVGYALEIPGIFTLTAEVVPVFTSEYASRKKINYKGGIEIFFTQNACLRGGFFTDYSQQEKVTATSENFEKIDYYGGSMSFSFAKEMQVSEGKKTEVRRIWTTIGLIGRYGIGKVQTTRLDSDFNETTLVKSQKVLNYSAFIAESISF